MQDQEFVKFLSVLLTLSMSFAFFRSFIKSMDSGKTIDIDKIELFTIKEISPSPSPIKASCSIAIKRGNVQKQKPKRNSNGYTELQMDCFSALKSLGVKTKKEQVFLVNTIFNKHDPKTVEEFIKLAFGK